MSMRNKFPYAYDYEDSPQGLLSQAVEDKIREEMMEERDYGRD